MNSYLSTWVTFNMGWKELVISQNLIGILIQILPRSHLNDEYADTFDQYMCPHDGPYVCLPTAHQYASMCYYPINTYLDHSELFCRKEVESLMHKKDPYAFQWGDFSDNVFISSKPTAGDSKRFQSMKIVDKVPHTHIYGHPSVPLKFTRLAGGHRSLNMPRLWWELWTLPVWIWKQNK